VYLWVYLGFAEQLEMYMNVVMMVMVLIHTVRRWRWIGTCVEKLPSHPRGAGFRQTKTTKQQPLVQSILKTFN
jgi:hypothetical protein